MGPAARRTWKEFSARSYLSMGLYTNDDLPTWPSRVVVVWAKVMETTRIRSAHAEAASEHAANGEDAYDVINLFLFSHLVTRPSTMWTLLPLSLLCLLDVTLADPASIPFQDCFNQPDILDQKFNVSTVYAQVLQNADLGNYLNLTVFGTSPKPILGLVNTSLGMRPLVALWSVILIKFPSHSFYIHICAYSRHMVK